MRTSLSLPRSLLRDGYLWPIAFLGVMAVVGNVLQHYRLGINLSDSMPGTIYIIQMGVRPAKGDLAQVQFNGTAFYKKDTRMIKQVVGVAGSVIQTRPLPWGFTDVRVDGVSAGVAKPLARDGRALTASSPRILAAEEFYVAAPHPDSFDSRYREFGEVWAHQVVGRAIEIF